MFFAIPVLVLAAFLAKTVIGLEAPLSGYRVEKIQWEVQAFPDGPKINMTGTIEEIYSQLTKINPSFDADFATVEDSNNIQGSNLEKRSGTFCGAWDDADLAAILEGIRYLRKVNGQPTGSPGPGACGRVSCSYKSAIWWCNDNTFTFSLPSFGTIADCAQAVADSCRVVDTNTGFWTVHGQNFNDDNWNCIIRGDTDHC